MTGPGSKSLQGLAGLAVAAILAAGCGGGGGPSGPGDALPSLASCGTGTAVFSVLPIASGEFTGWVPLGAMNPPGHTLPTDHQYVYLSDPGQGSTPPVRTVYAPGNITITGARSSTYSSNGHTDYSVSFYPCREVMGEFGHVQSLMPDILARLGAFDQFCQSYSPQPGQTVTQCQTKQVEVAVTAGSVLGTSGGVVGQFGLDFSLFDARISPLVFANPSRYPSNSTKIDHFHVVPASDYFAEPALSTIRSKLGKFDGQQQRTVAPYGGTIAVDVGGTAQGAWFNPGQPTYPESMHLTLSPDNVDPALQVFSIGLSLPGLAGWYRFTPQASGTVNRPFSAVTANGATYCWEQLYSGILLGQLVDATTLRLEARPGTFTCAAAQPYTFTGAAFDYKR